ncbi:carbonic anhydrase [Streptomyces viridochromogenes]|uniref:carbonic anhydrase n=1 Tax=Streptomyces viridochromogenes TaxID=1938 RepID=UPI00069F9F89|nr:carbonic anhydrase [Streptomyces viridochromogenes]KOG08766.1 carbonic anhydrase [Streptomyces viridochromogenes]KOG09108.1 carbonic anhydrase [Streptomyces viridochromogenes]
MGSVSQPQRRAVITGGLVATAAVITGCSTTSDNGSAPQPSAVAAAAPASSGGAPPKTPSAALARLLDGNKRWVNGTLQRPNQGLDRRESVAEEQDPYGVIVSCIDSRVPPEMVFDTGIGDLFSIRTGGQVVAPVVTGSVEYGPVTSGTPLILVLGHQRCGAVKASYKALKERKPLPGDLQSIAEAVRPAYEAVSKVKHADPVDAMIRAHAQQTAAGLRTDPALAPLVKKGGLAVVSAYYSLDTGRMEIIDGAPPA